MSAAAPQPERTTVYEGGIFRVEHQPVPHRDRPYEFATRVGSALVLPITFDEKGAPLVVAIRNERHHYGTSMTLPGGYLEGGLDDPEAPLDAALRELREETGYGFKPGDKQSVSLFSLRNASNIVRQARYFAVMRGVSYIGGERQSDHERVTVQPVPLVEFMDPFFNLSYGGVPELNLAFGRAAMELGPGVVVDWLASGAPENATAITQSFRPWMFHI